MNVQNFKRLVKLENHSLFDNGKHGLTKGHARRSSSPFEVVKMDTWKEFGDIQHPQSDADDDQKEILPTTTTENTNFNTVQYSDCVDATTILRPLSTDVPELELNVDEPESLESQEFSSLEFTKLQNETSLPTDINSSLSSSEQFADINSSQESLHEDNSIHANDDASNKTASSSSSDDEIISKIHQWDPVDRETLLNHFDKEGRLVYEHELRKLIFKGGVENEIRQDVWEFLFELYPCNSTSREREFLKAENILKYAALKRRWKKILCTLTSTDEKAFKLCPSWYLGCEMNLLQKELDRKRYDELEAEKALQDGKEGPCDISIERNDDITVKDDDNVETVSSENTADISSDSRTDTKVLETRTNELTLKNNELEESARLIDVNLNSSPAVLEIECIDSVEHSVQTELADAMVDLQGKNDTCICDVVDNIMDLSTCDSNVELDREFENIDNRRRKKTNSFGDYAYLPDTSRLQIFENDDMVNSSSSVQLENLCNDVIEPHEDNNDILNNHTVCYETNEISPIPEIEQASNVTNKLEYRHSNNNPMETQLSIIEDDNTQYLHTVYNQLNTNSDKILNLQSSEKDFNDKNEIIIKKENNSNDIIAPINSSINDDGAYLDNELSRLDNTRIEDDNKELLPSTRIPNLITYHEQEVTPLIDIETETARFDKDNSTNENTSSLDCAQPIDNINTRQHFVEDFLPPTELPTAMLSQENLSAKDDSTNENTSSLDCAQPIDNINTKQHFVEDFLPPTELPTAMLSQENLSEKDDSTNENTSSLDCAQPIDNINTKQHFVEDFLPPTELPIAMLSQENLSEKDDSTNQNISSLDCAQPIDNINTKQHFVEEFLPPTELPMAMLSQENLSDKDDSSIDDTNISINCIPSIDNINEDTERHLDREYLPSTEKPTVILSQESISDKDDSSIENSDISIDRIPPIDNIIDYTKQQHLNEESLPLKDVHAVPPWIAQMLGASHQPTHGHIAHENTLSNTGYKYEPTTQCSTPDICVNGETFSEIIKPEIANDNLTEMSTNNMLSPNEAAHETVSKRHSWSSVLRKDSFDGHNSRCIENKAHSINIISMIKSPKCPYCTTDNGNMVDKRISLEADVLESIELQAHVYAGRQPYETDVVKQALRIIDKDVPRTDRDQIYFSGDDNPNLLMLRDALITYSFFHPDVGYAQGMNDILSRFLVVTDTEADAYWMLVSYMNHFKDDFLEDGMLNKISFVEQMLLKMDRELHEFLLSSGADLMFCHRWLLLSFKREFCYEDALRIFEIMSSRHLEVSSAEAAMERSKERAKELERGEGTRLLEEIDVSPEYSFDIFVCVALLREYRGMIMKCDDISSIYQMVSGLPKFTDVTTILMKAENLFYKYCRKSVVDCFQLIDEHEVSDFGTKKR